jgi:uncharacterized NAD(P)/FAD-binding protein YdhS
LTTVPDNDDVLIIGTGLSMVDVALSLTQPHRTVHAISRHGLLPQAHAATPLPPAPPPESITPANLTSARSTVLRYIATHRKTGRDWPSAIDGLHPVFATWWGQLPIVDRIRFLQQDRRIWDIHRH